MVTTPRDNRLIDALEAMPVEPYVGAVWRVVREGRDPFIYAASGSRWDDGTFDVLYTAMAREGAVAEMYFHLKSGQPVFPSKLRYTLHELHVSLNGILDLSNLEELGKLGLGTLRYGRLSYQGRKGEYPSSQEIAEVANFVGSSNPGDVSGLMVPSARWNCANLVVFCGHAGPAAVEEIANHGLVDWQEWELAQN